jgi:hypothetical protein
VKVTVKYLANDCETGPSMVKEKFTLDDRDREIVCALLKALDDKSGNALKRVADKLSLLANDVIPF